MSSATRESIAPAATVVLLREVRGAVEVLLVQRASELVFHGGAWVFPGGRVDAEDGGDPHAVETARRAAVREAYEEASVLLSAVDLVAYSHWTTPEGRPRRFATWFFLAAFQGGDVVVDGGEIHDHQWMSPRAALAAQARAELVLPPPTFVTLASLVAAHSTAAVLDAARARKPPVFVPRPRVSPSGVVSLYHGDAAYEGAALDADGPRHRLVMDAAGYRYENSDF